MLVAAGTRNPTISHLRRLSGRRRSRREAGEVLVEGARAVADALADGCIVTSLVVAGSAAEDPSVEALAAEVHAAGAPALVVADHVLERIASTATPQPVVASIRWSPQAVEDLPAAARLLLLLAGVADPGNAGALLRVAEAAGVGAVVFADDAVDPTNPKVVRAAAGSLFRLPVAVTGPSAGVVARWRAEGRRCLGLAGRGGTPYDEVDPAGRLVLVVGSEAHGLPEDTLAELDGTVTIPMDGRVESLNAAVAAAVVCFELRRRS